MQIILIIGLGVIALCLCAILGVLHEILDQLKFLLGDDINVTTKTE